MPSWICLNFQDSRSFSIRELRIFHDHVVVVISGVIILIVYIILYILNTVKFYKNLSEGTLIETVWSIVPAFLLIILVIPSIKVLYLIEDIKTSSLRFKVIAHQWYWSYVVPLYKNFSFKLDNNMFSNYEYDSIIEGDLNSPRLLGCRSSLLLPLNRVSRFLISSTDVIHSFTVPSLGIKVDALPGRINQLFTNPSRLGRFYGQCSEICGSNHSFIPIRIKVVSLGDFDKYSKFYLLEILEGEGVKTIKI